MSKSLSCLIGWIAIGICAGIESFADDFDGTGYCKWQSGLVATIHWGSALNPRPWQLWERRGMCVSVIRDSEPIRVIYVLVRVRLRHDWLTETETETQVAVSDWDWYVRLRLRPRWDWDWGLSETETETWDSCRHWVNVDVYVGVGLGRVGLGNLSNFFVWPFFSLLLCSAWCRQSPWGGLGNTRPR